MNIGKRILVLAAWLSCLAGSAVYAQMPSPGDTPPGDAPPPPSASPQQGQGEDAGRARGLFGKIAAINGNSLQISGPDGKTVTVKITGETQFRKDRQNATLADFKVGDMIGVRGTENSDHSWTAQMIGTRGAGGPGGPGGAMGGTLGKDFVVGEVKAIDAPKITVLRIDNVTQTLELNEETALRRGRESITMADVQVGDHVMARGAVQNGVFAPKAVNVIPPEQWQRMQQFLQSGGPAQNGAPKPDANQQKTTEPQN